jgi:hypothetical protein
MKLIFDIQGGAGKVLAATPAVLKKYEIVKFTFPEVECIVLTHYPDLWENLGVTALHSNEIKNFYRDYVHEKNSMIYAHDPYLEGSYINGECNLVEAYFKIYGIEEHYAHQVPVVKFSENELSEIDSVIGSFGNEKPIVAIQISGGPENQKTSYSWTRDFHESQAQVLIDSLSDRFNFIQIRREDQTPLYNIHTFNGSRREIMAFLSRCSAGLFIDSFAQHAAAAVGLKSVVLFIGTDPNQSGYVGTNTHINIVTKVYKNKDYPENAVFFPYHLWGDPFQCPYDSPELFDLQEVGNALLYQLENKKLIS